MDDKTPNPTGQGAPEARTPDDISALLAVDPQDPGTWPARMRAAVDKRYELAPGWPQYRLDRADDLRRVMIESVVERAQCPTHALAGLLYEALKARLADDGVARKLLWALEDQHADLWGEAIVLALRASPAVDALLPWETLRGLAKRLDAMAVELRQAESQGAEDAPEAPIGTAGEH